jgi:hypothetical protein
MRYGNGAHEISPSLSSSDRWIQYLPLAFPGPLERKSRAHTVATLMLDAGADIRHIQAILGDSQLSTTEIYTQVSIQKLKALHALTHPASRTTPTD